MTDSTNGLDKLRELIADIHVAFVTTVAPDGSLHTRPMATQELQEDGTLWFATSRSSGKVAEVDHEHHVNIAYSDAGSDRYVSVSGLATVVEDDAKARDLWSPMMRAWFSGPEDPDLVLLRVVVESAEYWEAKYGRGVQLLAIAATAVTGRGFDATRNERLDLGID